MKRLGLCLKMTCVLLLMSAPAGGAQKPTKEEERLARETAVAFSERLVATRDFGPVVKELYADDFMKHYFARVSQQRQALNASPLTKGIKVDTFMLYVVPALTFSTELLARPDDEHWPRLYAAASDLMLYPYLSLLTKGSVKEWANRGMMSEGDILSVYAPESIKLLEKNPTTANFPKRRGADVAAATPDDLRRMTETLEEAARLTRPRLEGVLASGGTQFAQNLELLKMASERSPVELVPEGAASPVLYPPGTRVFKVFSPLLYDLYLVNEGGRMKVAWANLPTE
ncbi:MAG TPA: hypothetical protein VGX48_10030 [Pyrinomonadaceae bacterium]|jgi:hypothetical protein|nr:hypothetical protein [Pyrinomonadaceae bacterium]